MKSNFKKTVALMVSVITAMSMLVLPVANASQVTPYPTEIINGGFETHNNSAGSAKGNYFYAQAKVLGWSTTASDGKIEIWANSYKPVTGPAIPARSGKAHAEINANMPATLYQDIATTKNTIYKWSMWHRGRNGVDVAELSLGEPGAAASQTAEISDDLTWGYHVGYYSAVSEVTRFSLASVSTANNKAMEGNFIDDIAIVKVVDPTIQTIYVGDPTPVDETLASFTADAEGMTCTYAADDEYSDTDVNEDGNQITPPDLSIPGTYPVKVKIFDPAGNHVGYIISTIIVLDTDKANLTVNYVDENGKQLLPPEVTIYVVDDEYNVNEPEDEIVIDGKTYIYTGTTSDSDSLAGTIDEDKEITFVLKLKEFDLSVSYVDVDGNQIGNSELTTYKSGEAYDAGEPEVGDEVVIDGVTYIYAELGQNSDQPFGSMDSDKNVVFVLEEKASAPTTPVSETKKLEWMRSSELEEHSFLIGVIESNGQWSYKNALENTPIKYFANTSIQNAANSMDEAVLPLGEQIVNSENIWDEGLFLDKYKKANGNTVYDWASWNHWGVSGEVEDKGEYSLRRFSTYLDLSDDDLDSMTEAVIAPEDELGNMSYLFPINDNVFVFVNGKLAYWGGTDVIAGNNQYGALNRSKFMGVDGIKVRNGVNGIFKSIYPHTDGWCIDLQEHKESVNIKDLLVEGFNRIDIFADDYWEGGGMNKLNLYIEGISE